MKNISRFNILSFFLIAAYLLSACGAALPGNNTSAKGPKVQANVVAFTGMVEALNGTELTVGGQKLKLDSQSALDPNIAVGDEVKVEGNVLSDGTVVALKVESTKFDDVASPTEASSTEAASNSSSPDLSSTQAPTEAPVNTTGATGNQVTGTNANEIFGAVEALTANTITVNGVTYNLSQNFTEFKNTILVGDQVKLHVTINTDGTLTVREVEKSPTSLDTSSSGNNSSLNGSDDGSNHDANDDKSKHKSSDDSNDDSNDDNSGSGGDS